MISLQSLLNTLRPRQNGRHFADAIFKRIFVNENIWIPIKISPKFVPKGSINNIPALVQIMAWHCPDDKPLSEPMVVNLPTLICLTWPQWGNTLRPRQNGHHFADDISRCIFLNENIWILNKISLKYVPLCLIDNMAALVQIMAWRRSGDKPLSEAILVCSTDAYVRLLVSMSISLYIIQWLDSCLVQAQQWFR